MLHDGEVVFEDEVEMADYINEIQIGEVDNMPKESGKFKFYIYSKEGTIPHFHVLKASGGFESCIELYRPKYFSHGNKMDTFTNKQLRFINSYLSSITKKSWPNTVWNYMKRMWKVNNPEISKIPEVNIQPDYTTLNG